MNARSTPLSSKVAGVVLALLGLAACAVFVAYLSVRHVLWPRVDQFRPQLVAELERRLGRPVSIDALRPAWEGLHPSLEVDGLRIGDVDDGGGVSVAAGYARVSWRSLLLGRPRLAALRLDSARLSVERLADGRVAVAGFDVTGDGSGDATALDWLLEQGEIAIVGASVRFEDRTGAIAPLQVDGLALQLDTTGRHHQASVAARPGDAADALAVVVDVVRPPFSLAADWRRWRGELHASAQRLDLARVAALAGAFGARLPDALAAAGGRVDALAWARFDDAELEDATLKLRAERLATSVADGPLAIDALGGEARVTRTRDRGWTVRATGLSATDGQGFSLVADGDAELGLDAALGLRTAWLRLKSFEAAAALDAVRRLPLPAGTRAPLERVDLAGEVRDLTLRWTRPDAPRTETRTADRSADAERARPAGPRFELLASFDGLALRLADTPAGRAMPGFSNLSGSVRASDADGRLTVAARDATLIVPGVFEDPRLRFDRLDGELDWTVDPATGGLGVAVPRLAFVNADARGTASGRWRALARGPGAIDLSGRIERIDARRVPRYLPRQLPAHAREWIEHAVVAGTAEDVRFDVRGDLWHFPFRDPAEGRFRIAARVRDATLDYAPRWPRIEQIRGELAFEGAGLEIRAQAGAVEGVRLSDVRARLPEYRDGLLTIEGAGAGAAQDMLRFVDASPIAATVSTFTRDLRISGDARLRLALTLPLADLAATRVSGTVELPGNDVSIDRTLPPFDGVTGRLVFDEHGITLPGLRATLLGGPVRVEARPSGEGRMRIDAAGSIDAAGMRTLVDNPLTRRLEGRTDYRARVEVDRRASSLHIESDLVGLSSTLPAPFAKTAAEPWPLRVETRPLAPREPGARPPGDRLELRLRDDVALALERERDPGSERLVVRRAGFAVGAEPALRDAGLSVIVRAPAIDLDAWRAVLGDGELERIERSARGAAAGMSLVPDLVSVVADDLHFAGRDLHEVVIGASRTGGRWRANVASREIEGHFDWRDARPGERAGTLTARFDRLELPRSRVGEVESALSRSPEQLPALDVAADRLVLGGVPMGRLTLAATNGGTAQRPVWRVDRLVIVNSAARLEARGSWAFTGASTSPDGRGTALDFDLEVLDAGRLLTGLGLKDTMNGGSGTLAGHVAWHGSPVAIDYPSLDGRLELALGKGEFLRADPGIAKLIGVLNLQSLPKRLSGDFRDLFGDGFAFDSIAGNVRVEDGIARTDDLRMRGLQAQVTIRGEADLQRETQRLNVEVLPELNAGLASLAFGAMVNPVIGLGSFAAQYVLRKPLQDVLAYDIDVTGSWSDPTVSERNRRLAPRTDAPSP